MVNSPNDFSEVSDVEPIAVVSRRQPWHRSVR